MRAALINILDALHLCLQQFFDSCIVSTACQSFYCNRYLCCRNPILFHLEKPEGLKIISYTTYKYR